MAVKKVGNMNAAKLLAALGKIGYQPVSAILDMVDNSVSAGATSVAVQFSLSRHEDASGRKRTLIDSISIVDDGKGMDEDGIDNALSLGSSSEFYEAGTLSKFGLGLKSASSSLGSMLTITSRKKNDKALTATLDRSILTSDYEYELDAANEEAIELLDSKVGRGQSGTIVRIDKIHHESMPRAIEIIEELKRQAGVIFYYYIKGELPANRKVGFTIDHDGSEEAIEAFDPLFLNEISKSQGNLDEREWDGQSVKWITRPQKFQLDANGKIWATIEISQLPHPPSVATFGESAQAETRKIYNIGAGNYGFYIYRNGRLISWADSLGGKISQDQDLYAFRGRVLIDDDADEILNLDVTKSRIHLSEIAKDQLDPIINEAKKKSIAAWKNAGSNVARHTESDPHSEINAELDRIGDLDEKGQKLDEDVANESDRKKLRAKRENLEKSTPIKPEEAEKLQKKGERVQYVDELESNQLWERAHDPEQGLIVRVNKSHSLYRDIISVKAENTDLIRTLDILFFALAKGEYMTLYRGEFDEKIASNVLDEFREQAGGSLAEILRQIAKSA